ncbi:YecA family protein [Burkholderia vietnamiensis]|uniref:YecA family protein n=1 Tax=Burkholderia vietnamiensis TaxID=60552 RepID=UPI00264E3425|nr:SEC-C metal-binding domain-containing protein [Burkholderia vietnamiensis]MDN8070574.1 SEC-C metal-binding domain-containing protein [Burkholderia vietnamiensis]
MRKHNKRSSKAKPAMPDEVFSNGALQVARFGKQVVLTSNWTEKQHAEVLAKLAARYPSVVQEIDDLVGRIVSAIGVLPPDQVLARAWREQVMSSRHIKVEVDVTQDDAIALRMIDYVQSVIAAAPRGEAQKNELADDDWRDLRTNVAALFRKLNIDYPSCSTAHRKAAGTVYDDAMEEFFVRAQMHWSNVRGDYYPVHQVDVIADLLKIQSKLIEAAYGISSDELAAKLENIWRSLTFGLHEAMTSILNLHGEVMTEVQRMIERKEADLQSQSVRELIFEAANRLGHGDTLNRSAEAIGNMGLFDLRKITDLPTAFLDDFSWAPGQETDFLADGEFKGWPLRVQPIFRRPFLRFNDTYYCFELQSLFDNFYRQLEKRIFQRSEAEKQEWIRNRKEISETLPVDYFTRLLPGATVLREIYYPVLSESGSAKNLAEADCVIVYDDHMFIIEVKAGAFTYTSPANDLPAYVKSLEALVGAPSKQGQRFLKYLESAEEVEIFDAKRRPVGKLRKGDFRYKFICAVTLDPFTELAAQAQHLHKIGVDVGDVPVWPLSLSDLRVYSDIFAGPLDFLHFVEQRMRAATSEKLQLDDELDHLGLYLEHNNYAMHADELSQTGARLRFNGYRSAIDSYFSAKLTGSDDLSLPTQKVPPRLRELVDFLAKQSQPHRSRIASYLLDLAGDWRSDLSKWIDEELTAIPHRGRCLPLSTVGNVRLTIFVNIEDIVELSHEQATEHTQATMIVTGESDRVLLELMYGPNGPTRVSMSTVSLSGLSREQLERLKEKATDLKEKRLARSVANFGKIGRNELCPCGSGKKFKRCCMPSA